MPAILSATFPKLPPRSSDATESSNMVNETYMEADSLQEHVFEGAEKTLEVDFFSDLGDARGLRALSRAQLDHICKAARCMILTCISNSMVDAYVLSESSLFVYSHKIVMKTCGTTMLLNGLTAILEHAEELGLEVSSLNYSRRNFKFPELQEEPHQSFQTEVDILQRLFPDGDATVLGPMNKEHFYLFTVDRRPMPAEKVESVVELDTARDGPSKTEGTGEEEEMEDGLLCSGREGFSLLVMMTDLDPARADLFRSSLPGTEEAELAAGTDAPESPERAAEVQHSRSGAWMTKASGISGLFPEATLDDRAFEPCGYSMNGLLPVQSLLRPSAADLGQQQQQQQQHLLDHRRKEKDPEHLTCAELMSPDACPRPHSPERVGGELHEESRLANGACARKKVSGDACGLARTEGAYFTIHVTPEPQCSYASFETNARLGAKATEALLERVLAVFRPGRFSMVLYADADAAARCGRPLDKRRWNVTAPRAGTRTKSQEIRAYRRTSMAHLAIENERVCDFAIYTAC